MFRLLQVYSILPFLLLITCIQVHSQWEHLRFESLTIDEGLPTNQIFTLCQDSKGFLWIGTMNGLARYDGYEFKLYSHDPLVSESISSNDVEVVFEDSYGTLWIGTIGGLDKYDSNMDSFVHYSYNPTEPFSISSNVITTIYEDKNKVLWIGTNGGGLNKYDKKTDRFKRYVSTQGELNTLGGNYVTSICEDSSGNLWIGLYGGGVNKFNSTSGRFTKYYSSKENQVSISSNVVSCIYVDSRNNIWVGTEDNGLNKYDEESDTFVRFIETSDNKIYFEGKRVLAITEISSGELLLGIDPWLYIFNQERNRIVKYKSDKRNLDEFLGLCRIIIEDMSGLIWVGTDALGLKKFNPDVKFHHFKNIPGPPHILQYENTVMTICSHTENEVWIGEGGGGLTLFNFILGDYIHFENNPNDPHSISSNAITSVYKDKAGNVWCGTFVSGLNRLIPDDRVYNLSTFKRYNHNPQNKYSISSNSIGYILEDSYGNLWVGTRGAGLNKTISLSKNLNNLDFICYKNESTDFTSISNDYITVIYEDKNKDLWVGTMEGLNKYIHADDSFIRYYHEKEDKQTLSSNFIFSIYEDKSDNFWIGTNAGLNKFDRSTGKCIKYTQNSGLPDNIIYRIEEDDKGNMWISTNNGLSKFNPDNESFRNYDVNDGLQAKEFNQGASLTNKRGYKFFGGFNGFNVFHPDSIKENKHIPPIVVTDFQLNNISVPVGYDSSTNRAVLKHSITETRELELNYDDKVISFEFAALDFYIPEKNKYAYMLEGFDGDWNYTDASRRLVTYTNLDPGDYTFRVKGSNNDGYWNEEGVSLSIIIHPPWWATSWAYLFYTLLIIGIIYFTWKLQLRRIRIKHDYEMSKFEAEKMHEVDELKSRFFANISHEFRTPLTLIFGPANDVLEKCDDPSIKKNAGIIKRNANRLYGLVNQLLDLSKLESGKLKLEASERDIIPILKGIFLSFTSLAERRKITLRFNTKEQKLNLYVDRDKVEKIINNLLSNAFKFTPEGGIIDFTVEKLINDVEIGITDNGIGIPKERIDKIFDRFYQVDSSHTRQGEGTGIGLALTKELVELHKGNIKVESKEGEGTTVKVLLPLGKDHLKPEEIVEKQVEEIIPETEELPELDVDNDNRKEKTLTDVLLETDRPLLLIVEDNSDVRSYIISHLEEDYRIQEAIDGKEGLDQAIKHIPDLIISDVMMPKMDGFELCNILKTDERTSHIPIIMLTAKATSKDKIEGYETGADDYIMKPFDATELRVRIKNLIEIRRKLQKKFSQDDYAIPKELNSLDQQFMERVLKIINEHISEEEFSIDELGKKSAMSRAQIYNKIKALTGKSPSQFVRSVRLTTAKKMIKEHKGTISEISYSVGFNSPAYFTKCFRDEFGFPPSELSNS